MSQPERGEVWWVDLGIAGKVRPAVVISAALADDDYALVATVPHTTSDHPSQYAVSIPITGLKAGVLNVQGLAPIPLGKFIRRIAALSRGAACRAGSGGQTLALSSLTNRRPTLEIRATAATPTSACCGVSPRAASKPRRSAMRCSP
ncbi:MAG: mRNA interferase MazF [Chthoniobacter sp.]|jgi:mRNA interferase MazF|nr:mRNA interferase MazF [Chthoniobacter sp.]